MTDDDQTPEPDFLRALLEDGEDDAIVSELERLGTADVDTRKDALRAARDVASEQPGRFDGVVTSFAAFLTDDDRAVRLTTAKLFAVLAEGQSEVALAAVDALAERVADDDEFYLVRARCAEALGYVARDVPEAVGDPEILADFRVGLSFERTEVREKLAKALADVALGDPSRLRHHVASLADHLDDDSELVRYHLCTALVVVGCERPERLSDAADALRELLHDESPQVRARAAEGLALLVRAGESVESVPDRSGIESATDDPPSFLTDRVDWLRAVCDPDEPTSPPDSVGTVESIRAETADVVEAITSPDGDSECPHCGLDLPGGEPPLCPRCGAPL